MLYVHLILNFVDFTGLYWDRYRHLINNLVHYKCFCGNSPCKFTKKSSNQVFESPNVAGSVLQTLLQIIIIGWLSFSTIAILLLLYTVNPDGHRRWFYDAAKAANLRNICNWFVPAKASGHDWTTPPHLHEFSVLWRRPLGCCETTLILLMWPLPLMVNRSRHIKWHMGLWKR